VAGYTVGCGALMWVNQRRVGVAMKYFDACTRADFATLREGLGVADSVLSKHIRVLHEAGYVEVHKATCASRVRTSLSLTEAGRAAYDGHVAAMRSIVGNGDFRGSARRRSIPAE